jgi:hypothetical protein
MVHMNLKALGISQTSLSKCSNQIGHAAAMRSQLCELGKERTMAHMNLKALGISQTSLSKCSNLEMLTSRQQTFDCLTAIANEQERVTENPMQMTHNELTNHRLRGEGVK